MNELKALLEKRVKDKITGFTGTATGAYFTIEGKKELFVEPVTKKDLEPRWIALSRLIKA
jgi:hypothetical protein